MSREQLQATQSLSSGSETKSSIPSTCTGDVMIGVSQVPGDAEGVQSVSLSRLVETQQAIQPSLGSAYHSIGQCRPCVFENRRQFVASAKPCIKGSLCEFCHEHHECELKKAKRQAARQHAAKQRREASAQDSAGDTATATTYQ